MEWSPIEPTVHVRAYAFGQRLIPERLGKQGVPEGTVAETWEVSDYREARATVRSGPGVGGSLHDLVMAHPDEVVGQGWRGPHFPLLGKFLDASHMLPVHLHADDETAARVYGEPNGKTEAWHILWCAPDATILTGVKPGLSEDDLRVAFKRQDYRSVMFEHPLAPGDTVYVPGGILHAFGPDTLIFEIQQTSDLGQHVMPNDLNGRRLTDEEWDAGIERTLAELKRDFLPRPHPGLDKPGDGSGNRFRVGGAGPHFAIERWTLVTPHQEPAHSDRCLILSNVGDPVTLRWAEGEQTVERASSRILPAAIGEVEIVPTGETADLIVCYVPNLDRDIVGPLRAAGHPDEAIGGLGEVGSGLRPA
ncbi:MAG TPA: class I mannose-6-phosphate isomerase [Thermomicrobiales bacterium]|nr:class I mannose-6-phosphate isomerase [Thermomicrobiales bacterium]